MTETQAIYRVPKPSRKKRKKKCKVCGSESQYKCCSVKCALKQVEKDRQKRERIETRKKLESLKTLSDYLKEAQHECNSYIRVRDKDQPCISCARFHVGQWHAGHYRSAGAAPQLRFNEDNINRQCAPCNNHKSGNAIEYRINLIKKIGIERVEALESNNSPALFTIEDAKRIKAEFKKKLLALKQQAQELGI